MVIYKELVPNMKWKSTSTGEYKVKEYYYYVVGNEEGVSIGETADQFGVSKIRASTILNSLYRDDKLNRTRTKDGFIYTKNQEFK